MAVTKSSTGAEVDELNALVRQCQLDGCGGILGGGEIGARKGAQRRRHPPRRLQQKAPTQTTHTSTITTTSSSSSSFFIAKTTATSTIATVDAKRSSAPARQRRKSANISRQQQKPRSDTPLASEPASPSREVRFDPPWASKIGQLQNVVGVLRNYADAYLRNRYACSPHLHIRKRTSLRRRRFNFNNILFIFSSAIIVRCFADHDPAYMTLAYHLVYTIVTEISDSARDAPLEIRPIFMSGGTASSAPALNGGGETKYATAPQPIAGNTRSAKKNKVYISSSNQDIKNYGSIYWVAQSLHIFLINIFEVRIENSNQTNYKRFCLTRIFLFALQK